MIFAAGLGTRLGALTQDAPKALIDVGGRSMLEHVARRLVAAGADRLIINAHHHADLLAEAVVRLALPAEIRLSFEERALETGGGLLRAAPHFRRDGPFLLHNVDVLSALDLRALYDAVVESDALAALAVHERATTRQLLFDAHGLCGRRDGPGQDRLVRPAQGEVRALAFTGVHAAAPQLLDRITERGRFSIMDVYLRLAADTRILPFDVTGVAWHEVGTPERLARARHAYVTTPQWADLPE